jgi:hypothetical protein
MAKIYNLRRDPAEEPIGTPVRDLYDLAMPAFRRAERRIHVVCFLLVAVPLALAVLIAWLI